MAAVSSCAGPSTGAKWTWASAPKRSMAPRASRRTPSRSNSPNFMDELPQFSARTVMNDAIPGTVSGWTRWPRELVNARQQVRRGEGLGEVGGGAGLEGRPPRRPRRETSHHDDGDGARRGRDRPHHVETVPVGKSEIGDDQPQGLSLDNGEGVAAARGRHHPIALPLEQADVGDDQIRLVVDDQHAPGLTW